MAQAVTMMMASRGCSITGSGTVSQRMSALPCQVRAFIDTILADNHQRESPGFRRGSRYLSLLLAALVAGFGGALRIVGEVARAALLAIRAAGLRLLPAVVVLASFLAGFGCALRIVGEVAGTATLFVGHETSPSII